MNAPERAYPLTLDPTILLHNKGNVLTTYIRYAAPNSVAPNAADQYCGYIEDRSYGSCDIYMKLNLPETPNGCVPVRAEIALYHAGFFASNHFGGAAPDGNLTVEGWGAGNRLHKKLTRNSMAGYGWSGGDNPKIDYGTLAYLPDITFEVCADEDTEEIVYRYSGNLKALNNYQKSNV